MYWLGCYGKYCEVAGQEIDEEVVEVARKIMDIGEESA